MADKPLSANERDLVRAVGSEDIDEVRRLIDDEGVNVNIQDSLQRTPILRACFASDKSKRNALGQLLLDHGADVNLTERHGRTALITACMEDEKEDMVELIMGQSNIDANRQDENGNTAIMHAVMIDNLAAVKVLLSPDNKSKVNSDMKNFQDQTPLLVAAKQQNKDMCELLVREGGANHEDIPSYFKQNLPEECQDEEKNPNESWNSLFKNYRDNAMEANIVQRSALKFTENSKKKGKARNKNPQKTPATNEDQKLGDTPEVTKKEEKKTDKLHASKDSPSKDKQSDNQKKDEEPFASEQKSESINEKKNSEKPPEGQLFFKRDVEAQERRKSSRRMSGGEELSDRGKTEHSTTNTNRASSSASTHRRSATDTPATSHNNDDDFMVTSTSASKTSSEQETNSNRTAASGDTTLHKPKSAENHTSKTLDKREVSTEITEAAIVVSNSAEVNSGRPTSIKEEKISVNQEIVQSNGNILEDKRTTEDCVNKKDIYARTEEKENRRTSPDSKIDINYTEDVKQNVSSKTEIAEKAEGKRILKENEEVVEYERTALNTQSPRRNDSPKRVKSRERLIESQQAQISPDTAKSSSSLRSNDSSTKRKASPTLVTESSRPTTVKSTRSMRSNASKMVSEGDTASLAPTESSMRRGTWIRPPPDMIRLQEEADEIAAQKGKSRKKVKLRKEDCPVYETKSGRIIRPNVCLDPKYTDIQASKLKIVPDEKTQLNNSASGGQLAGPSYEEPKRKPKSKRKPASKDPNKQ